MNLNETSFPENDNFNLLKTGDALPAFSWEDGSGSVRMSKNLSKNNILVMLLTADCRHCRSNLFFFEEYLFSRKLKDLDILISCRDCDIGRIELFRRTYKFEYTVIPDKDRQIYSMFAEKIVPRNYLFNAEHKLIQSIRGFHPELAKQMIHNILGILE